MQLTKRHLDLLAFNIMLNSIAYSSHLDPMVERAFWFVEPFLSVIRLNTSLQAVACRVSTPQPITVCSIYLPPSSSWTHAGLVSLVLQLPSPILLLGDFNAHDSLWGCTSTDTKGQEVANFLLQSNLCLMNKKDTTYIHPATGSRSSIDFAICDLHCSLTSRGRGMTIYVDAIIFP